MLTRAGITSAPSLCCHCRYFKAGSKAVTAAAERAKKQMALEKQRKEAEERQRQRRVFPREQRQLLEASSSHSRCRGRNSRRRATSRSGAG